MKSAAIQVASCFETAASPPPQHEARPARCVPNATTRRRYFAQCKVRALALLNSGNTRGAIASMLHDVGKWNGGEVCDAAELAMREVEAVFYTANREHVCDWIEAFY